MENNYVNYSGTSMSAAFVSGEAALVLSTDNNLDYFSIKDRILSTSDRLSSLIGKIYNGYKINCSSAINNQVSDTIIQINTLDTNEYSGIIETNQNDYTLYSDSAWVQKANIFATYDAAAASLNGKIYKSGGRYINGLAEWDPSDNVWKPKAGMSCAKYGHMMVSANGKLYVFWGLDGYYRPCEFIEVYDPSTNSWSKITSNIPAFREYAAYAVLDGIIYIMGGAIPAVGSTDSVIAFDTRTNTWSTKASLKNRTYAASATVLNGKIYMAGGYINGNGLPAKDLQVYDPVTNSWSTKASMNVARSIFSLQSSYDKIYAIGGGEVPSAINSVEMYSPETNTWTICSTMPVTLVYSAFASLANKIYVIGGLENNSPSNKMFEFTPDDFGNDINSSGIISEEAQVNGRINYAGDIDFMRFTATDTGSYSIYTTGSIDSYGEIYDSAGVLLASNNDSDGNTNFKISIDLKVGQTYYIAVKHNNIKSTGTYQLTVAKPLPAPLNITYTTTSNTITISWSAVQNASGYDIEVDGVVYNCPNLTYVHQITTYNRYYSYRVRGKNQLNVGAWSKRIFATINEDSIWQTYPDMPTPRRYLALASLDGKIYAIGGYNGSILNDVEAFDVSTRTWTTKADMQVPRYSLGVISLNGKLYAIGGTNGNSALSTVEEYDPLTNKWTAKSSMPTARYAFGICILDKKIYVIGGYSGTQALNIVEVYDPNTDSWSTRESMPTARSYFAIASINNKIYAIGGNDGINKVEEYDSVSDSWVTKANLPTPRYDLGAVVINNKIYAVGGMGTDNNRLNTVEVYSPEINIWASEESKILVSSSFGITTDGGNIYIIGGYNGDGYLSTVEVANIKNREVEYVYDENNRLIYIIHAGKVIVTYTYDKNGNLISTIVNQ